MTTSLCFALTPHLLKQECKYIVIRTSMCQSNIVISDAWDRQWWWLWRCMFNLNAREGAFFPLGTLCLSSPLPAPSDGRTSSENSISSKSKFQEFEHIHHKFCLSCGFCAWVASASIGQTKYKNLDFIPNKCCPSCYQNISFKVGISKFIGC